MYSKNLIKKLNVWNMLVLKYKFFYMHEHIIRNIGTKDHKTNMHIKCVNYPSKKNVYQNHQNKSLKVIN